MAAKPLNLNKFGAVVNRTEYLICGYTRFIINIYNQIIPTTIIQLIIKFYHKNLRIIYLEQVTDRSYITDCLLFKPPIIRISELENKRFYKCNIKPLDESYGDIGHKMSAATSVCYVKDFTISKKMLSDYDKLYNNQSYDVIFALSTNSTKESIGYIIDTMNFGSNDDINIYYWKLPETSSDLKCSFAVYSSKYGLISIGNKFNILNLNKEINEWKWQNNKIPNHETSEMKGWNLSAVMIEEDKLFCCGGNGREKISDVYDFNTRKWIKLATMINAREWAGICFDESKNTKVYVGGGYHEENKFEYYDIKKNKWYTLPNTNGLHTHFPVIWLENFNIINIASTTSAEFERLDVRENKWHTYIENGDYYDDNKPFNNLFGVEVEIGIEENRLCL